MPWPWSRKHDDSDPVPEGERVELYDLELDEVSFVDHGDNPGAKLVMYKRAGEDGQDAGGGENARLERMVDELIAEETGESSAQTTGKGSMQTMTKRADVLEEVERRAVEVRKQNDRLTPAQARVEIWMENEDLRRRYQELPPDVPVAASATPPVAKGAGALQKHAAAVAELRKSHPEMNDSQLRMKAWEQNPELAAEYQRAAFE